MKLYPGVEVTHPLYCELWLHHPVVGDASYDAFEREAANPIYVGAPPYEWPVNGFLFRDPPSGRLYAYIGLYPRGYWPAGGCRLLRSSDDGASWEDQGVVLEGSPQTFDGDGERPGAMPDVSLVYEDGRYHMVYDWATYRNDDGGIAYAWAERPEGPFHRAPAPIHAESRQPFLLGRYKRVYAATLIRRSRDWLITAAMSTPGNAGGSWAMVCFTAERPEGPYRGPQLLLYPQNTTFLPPCVECYPSFAHAGYLYAPMTSVARNRSYQVIYRAPLDEAHRPEAWAVYRDGSNWHAEPQAHEAQGIWGQTFAGLVDPAGQLRVLFPSKTAQDVGTINLARRPWAMPDRPGIVLSAPNAPALTWLQRNLGVFSLRAELRSTGAKTLFWQYNGPLGPDRPMGAEGLPHPLTLADYTALRLDTQGWALYRVLPDGGRMILAEGGAPVSAGMTPDRVEIEQDAETLAVWVNGALLWQGAHAPRAGSVGLLSEQGTILWADRLLLSDLGVPRLQVLLPTEALLGSGALPGSWVEQRSALFRYGWGYVSRPDAPGVAREPAQPAMAKWNYRGAGFRLWTPRGPDWGIAELYVDGRSLGEVVLTAADEQASRPEAWVELPYGRHAVSLVSKTGALVCDSLEVRA